MRAPSNASPCSRATQKYVSWSPRSTCSPRPPPACRSASTSPTPPAQSPPRAPSARPVASVPSGVRFAPCVGRRLGEKNGSSESNVPSSRLSEVGREDSPISTYARSLSKRLSASFAPQARRSEAALPRRKRVCSSTDWLPLRRSLDVAPTGERVSRQALADPAVATSDNGTLPEPSNESSCALAKWSPRSSNARPAGASRSFATWHRAHCRLVARPYNGSAWLVADDHAIASTPRRIVVRARTRNIVASSLLRVGRYRDTLCQDGGVDTEVR